MSNFPISGQNLFPQWCPPVRDYTVIWEMLPSVKIILSAPTIRVDKHNANENNINFIKLLETNDSSLIKHPNIKENHLDRYGLHLNHNSTRVLTKNLRLCAQKNMIRIPSSDMIRIPSRKLSLS